MLRSDAESVMWQATAERLAEVLSDICALAADFVTQADALFDLRGDLNDYSEARHDLMRALELGAKHPALSGEPTTSRPGPIGPAESES